MTAPAAITCPRTGRTWPRERQIDLRGCTVCGGWIDIRFEAWESGLGFTRHVTCPEQAAP